jgi:hypothetical protein
MLNVVEARGCIFQWIDKPFQVFYLYPLSWIVVSSNTSHLSFRQYV